MLGMTADEFGWLLAVTAAAVFLVGVVAVALWLRDEGERLCRHDRRAEPNREDRPFDLRPRRDRSDLATASGGGLGVPDGAPLCCGGHFGDCRSR